MSNFCLKKSKFLGNLLGKIEILLTRIHDPQISKQIDGAGFYQVSATRPIVNAAHTIFCTLLRPHFHKFHALYFTQIM